MRARFSRLIRVYITASSATKSWIRCRLRGRSHAFSEFHSSKLWNCSVRTYHLLSLRVRPKAFRLHPGSYLMISLDELVVLTNNWVVIWILVSKSISISFFLSWFLVQAKPVYGSDSSWYTAWHVSHWFPVSSFCFIAFRIATVVVVYSKFHFFDFLFALRNFQDDWQDIISCV